MKIQILTTEQSTTIRLQVESRMLRHANERKRQRAMVYLAERHVLHPKSIFTPKHKPVLTSN